MLLNKSTIETKGNCSKTIKFYIKILKTKSNIYVESDN
jgi:uncharacterized glyoxalase superfamily protein PhnB